MPKEYPRSERIASQIQRALAALIQGGLKDPRLTMPSILEVQVSKDLAHARVFSACWIRTMPVTASKH